MVQVHNLEGLTTSAFNAPILIGMTNGVDPFCGPNNELVQYVDGWPVFSECHRDLLCKTRGVDPDKCFVTGLGVDLKSYECTHEWNDGGVEDCHKVPGRLLYANDPARGLWHTLDIFDKLRELVPDVSLHVAYDFDKQFENYRWQATALSEKMWDCKKRLATTEGVVNVGALSRQELVREQLECQVHVMPSDPPNLGSQIHGITQMECAAAGAALVLSDIEAFPEVFGDGATILPLPGTYIVSAERRFDAQDWAETIADLMNDPEQWAEASRKARALAEANTWEHVLGKWDKMLDRLALGSLKELAVATAGS